MTKLIPLTKGQHTVVDDEDYEWLMQWKWHYHKNKYAARSVGSDKVFMHKFIMGAGPDVEVDHINRNKLDNQRENLRICTRQQNCCNTRKRGITSQYKGVTWHKRRQKWQAQITAHHQNFYLGAFNSELDAALAYDKAARIHHGEFVSTNF